MRQMNEVAISNVFPRNLTVGEVIELHDSLTNMGNDQLTDVLDITRALLADNDNTDVIMDDAYRLARLRRTAKRNGILIVRQAGRSIGESKYMLRDMVADIIVAGADPVPFSLTFDDVDGWVACMDGNTRDHD